MNRMLTLSSLLALGVALPAMAQDKVSPGAGPTKTITDQVPDMKGTPVPANTTTPSDKATAAQAQVPEHSVKSSALSLSDQEASGWAGKPIYSSDNKKIGEVDGFLRGADGSVTVMRAGIGGFLGIGETYVTLIPEQFKLQQDRVILSIPAAHAKDLPKVPK